MKRSLILFGALCLLTMFAHPAAAAHSSSKTYETSAVAVSLTGGPAGLDVGGVQFTVEDHDGQVPTSVEIADASLGAVSWIVCQDTVDSEQGDIDCGVDAGEPRVTGCSQAGDLSDPDRPDTEVEETWDPDTQIIVFINTASETCPGAVATTGTVTLNYAA